MPNRRFGLFDFNPDTGELFREGRAVRLQAQPARLLALLIAARGGIVTRESLHDALWPDGDVLRSARNLGTIALWPVIASARAVPRVRHYGAAVRRLTGKSRVRQFLEQVAMAVRFRIPPFYYYVYELFGLGKWGRAPHYLMRYETKEIAYRLLYPIAGGAYVPAPLKEKVEFARHCRDHGIRHVPVLMLFQDGERVQAPDLVDQLPEADVFVCNDKLIS